MLERRRYIRISEDDTITYSVLPKYKSERRVTKDLSAGGIRFFSDRFIPQRSILKAEIRLKYSTREIFAILKVAWARSIYSDESFEIGAEFMEINAEDLNFLNDYLNRK